MSMADWIDVNEALTVAVGKAIKAALEAGIDECDIKAVLQAFVDKLDD